MAGLASCVAFYAERFLRRHSQPFEGLEVRCEFAIDPRAARVASVQLRVVVPAFLHETLWGKETRSATPTWPFASRPTRHQTAQMLWSIRYRLLCWLLRVLVRCGLDQLDLETVVLHHQHKVLHRGGKRALFTTADRAFLAAPVGSCPGVGGRASWSARTRWRDGTGIS